MFFRHTLFILFHGLFLFFIYFSVLFYEEQEHSESANSAKAEMSTESGPGFEAGLILMGSRSLPDRSQSAWIHYLAGVGQFAKFSKTLQVTIWEISENPLFRNVEENGKVVRIHMRTPINTNNLGMCGIYFLFRFSFYSVWKTPFGSVNRQTDFFKDKESVYKSYWLCAVWRRRTTQWAVITSLHQT